MFSESHDAGIIGPGDSGREEWRVTKILFLLEVKAKPKVLGEMLS